MTNSASLPALTILGATGFVGSHFLAAAQAAGTRIRALTRSAGRGDQQPGVEWLVGDLNDPDIWPRLLEPGCTVVNLAYSQQSASDDAVAATRAMVKACGDAGVGRLIHCSTISVYGRTAGGIIDEATPCCPIDGYGRQKLLIEQALLDTPAGSTEIAVVRPAAVFGAGGLALRTLCNSLANSPQLINYGRSSLFGRRCMHLVPVETVVAALQFLCAIPRSLHREIFIVAEDDDPLNNFRDVEKVLMAALRRPNYAVPPLPLPPFVLGGLLRAKGRSEIDPYCRYSMAKLRAWGFVPPVGFTSALHAFAEHGCTSGT